MEAQQVNRMMENLYWRLRDRVFMMDNRGEGFPWPIAEMVVKNAPKSLLRRPSNLAEVTHMLMGVIVDYECMDECIEAIGMVSHSIKRRLSK